MNDEIRENGPQGPKTLEELRAEVGKVDNKLLSLLALRAAVRFAKNSGDNFLPVHHGSLPFIALLRLIFD